MTDRTSRLTLAALAIALLGLGVPHAAADPIIIDHTCTNLARIPDSWLDAVQANLREYYAHTSHGMQLTTGLQVIENDIDPKYSVAIGDHVLPVESGAFCIYDAADADPDDYWQENEWWDGKDVTRGVLNDNPTINVSMFCWCIQLFEEDEAYVQDYLDSMAILEAEHPNVTFIYATNPADFYYGDAYAYRRWVNNGLIRQHCLEHDKVLFDFEDLDSWWFNPQTQQWEQETIQYQGHTVPMRHSQYEGDYAGHTNYEGCLQKGKATWWMMARIAGWPGFVDTDGDLIPDAEDNCPLHPNPDQADGDDDDHGNVCDCAPTNPSVWSIPSEIGGLTLTGASPTQLSWTAQAPGDHYDVVGGLVSELQAQGGASGARCDAEDVAGASWSDQRPAPSAQAARYYLVRGQNVCGSGTYGRSSANDERSPTDGCE